MDVLRGCLNIAVFLINAITVSSIYDLVLLRTLAQETFYTAADFLSVDCGSSANSNYTNSLTGIDITWTPDTTLWPDIEMWSVSTNVNLPTNMTDEKQYSTLRYFPTTTSSSKALNQSKFCYTLPAIAHNYYLIRASFWYGLASTRYETRVNDQISFHVIVDNYEGVEIVIGIPQTYPWFEEMYIRAQTSVVSVCLSAASDSSDAPFINSLELRPLNSTMHPVEMINNTNQALRTVLREDTGTLSNDPPILRYPDDTIDRFWWRLANDRNSVIQTTQDVGVNKIADYPPMAAMQTSIIGRDITVDFSELPDVLTTSTMAGSHKYHMALFYAEIDPNINTSGQRVFDVTVNGNSFGEGLDIYTQNIQGLYNGFEHYTVTSRMYSDNIIIEATAKSYSLYPASIAGFEVLQLFDNPMNATTPTSASDVSALQDLFANLGSFLGDPCLPKEYKYLWIECDYSNPQLPARVTSIALSNYSLVGNLPASISNLDQLVKLDLSNNNLSGPIPATLSKLPKLAYLNLANNNFNGTVPETLLQKQSTGVLQFSYDGNGFLCATCGSSPSSSKHGRLMIGFITAGVLLFMMVILASLCFFIRRKTRANHNIHEIQLVQPQTPTHPTPYKYRDPSVNINTEDINNATKVARHFTFQEIQIATNNFSKLVGEGGFGPVYKGILSNGLEVAIKILSSTSTQGPQEFLNEVTLLSRVHHKNLVGFEGYCIKESLVLVYEFMSNGSLHDGLSRRKATRTLTWLERLQILFDAAQGLAYLHHGCNIIHRDVKSSNILLSKNLEGKMSDFGISKLKSVDSDNITTRKVGTFGYIDPQYMSTFELTQKFDIYSFGVVLLEALCGLPHIFKDTRTENGVIHIVEWVRPAYERGIIENIVDERLENNYNLSSIWKVVEIAMTCVQFEGAKRPTMNVVCNDLSEAIGMECSHESSPWTTTEASSIYSHVQVR